MAPRVDKTHYICDHKSNINLILLFRSSLSLPALSHHSLCSVTVVGSSGPVHTIIQLKFGNKRVNKTTLQTSRRCGSVFYGHPLAIIFRLIILLCIEILITISGALKCLSRRHQILSIISSPNRSTERVLR